MTDKRKRYPVQLTAETHAQLSKLAEQSHRTISGEVAYLLDYFTAREDTRPPVWSQPKESGK
jgi:hypothetical protein